jgi:alanyl-tRNA synthetase
LRVCEASDAILFGSVGGPKWEKLPPKEQPERAALLPLRKHFTLFRQHPAGPPLPRAGGRLPDQVERIPDGIDIVCIRELTGGLYFGKPKETTTLADGDVQAVDTMVYRKSEIERITATAIAAARSRKAEALLDRQGQRPGDVRPVAEDRHRLRRQARARASSSATCTWTTPPCSSCASPNQFDVFVTENMFGDILSDEMAVICGSLGMLSSASLGAGKNSLGLPFGLYEPAGGTAPDIAGKGDRQSLRPDPLRGADAALQLRAGENGGTDRGRRQEGRDRRRPHGRHRLRRRVVGTKAMADAVIARLYDAMTSAEIRQSFLDFFASAGTRRAVASLMPDSPGLLFTNAGMNQFVPIFLGNRQADVSQWAGAKPGKDTRAADTQKCIRAGGKHNDFEDVGFDTYHHTLFEMLGNWSFGDYFKKESLEWGWELLTKVWGMPAKRLFATVYQPGKGEPSAFDQEAYDIWAGIFTQAGLDPKVHIVAGNKKDNFWMMGDTGPCGPCSEIHFNLLPSDDEAAGRALVNAGSPRCIEIWNHVFIQFNANADGTFSPLAAKHVDTGMGFERVAGIHATTDGFKTFSKDPSNYAADIFAPLFRKITELSGKEYQGTVPTRREGLSEQENTDVAFRVLADHARCVACAIADGILPGNEARNYVIRRILRRGLLYGKKLGLQTGFFEQLIAPVVASLGAVFPELKQQQDIIQRVIRSEEESFGRTLDRGLQIFRQHAVQGAMEIQTPGEESGVIPGAVAFELYDTYGFPLDMTQLLATERGFTVDLVGFHEHMDRQRERGRAALKKDVVVAATEGQRAAAAATLFLGYDRTNAHAELTEVVAANKATFLVFDQTPFYGEMGGQAGDTGHALIDGQLVSIVDTIKDKIGRHLHRVVAEGSALPSIGAKAELAVDVVRRRAISRHHSATHLLHWALRKVLGTHVRQAGHAQDVRPPALRLFPFRGRHRRRSSTRSSTSSTPR